MFKLNNSYLLKVMLLLILLMSPAAFGQLEQVRQTMYQIASQSNGVVGLAVIDLQNGDTLSINGNGRFPMQSVYKFPLALAVLDRIDNNQISLEQKVRLTEKNLLPNMWSPMREQYPRGGVDVTVGYLLEQVITLSDNNACDLLFGLTGGPEAVNAFIQSHGIRDISILSTEEEMHRSWDVQYLNWSTPKAMARLFAAFSEGKIVSSGSSRFLWNLLTSNVISKKRLKGSLPDNALVAHKTGSSGTNADGVTAATNDAGIIVFPDGRKAVIVVFIKDSPDGKEVNEKIIASASAALWSLYSKKLSE